MDAVDVIQKRWIERTYVLFPYFESLLLADGLHGDGDPDESALAIVSEKVVVEDVHFVEIGVGGGEIEGLVPVDD
jgi:hypothetical protein